MRLKTGKLLMSAAGIAAMVFGAGIASAQVTEAKGYEPVDDTPTVRPGVTIYTDYTYQDQPEVTDSNHDTIHKSSFNVSRAYATIAGSISHLVAYRVTADVQADNNTSDSSLNGSNVFRLKYAYGQINADEWVGKGSWIRLGLQQTPWIDYDEGIYRYRFAFKTFTDVEGLLTSSDYGLSAHYNLPSNYGDFHVGVYNGEGYNSLADANGANDQKALEARFSLRPAPGVDVLKGLRLAVFYDGDNFVKDARKRRYLLDATFEHKYVNAGFEWVDAKNQTTPTAAEVHAQGWSAWVTPRTTFGLEGLLRYDELKPNKNSTTTSGAKKKRTIVGIAYWFPVLKGVSSALMADYTQVKFDSALNQPKNQAYALHALFSF
ncbi:MAG: hypothetical protein ACRD16_11650 [Thermoanaerobaculia bacterium]